MIDEKTLYVTKPTRSTLFMRTFLPFQIWRFVVDQPEDDRDRPAWATAPAGGASVADGHPWDRHDHRWRRPQPNSIGTGGVTHGVPANTTKA